MFLASLKQARYVGDLKVQHFSTPRKAKRNLDMLTSVVMSQKKKIKVLQQQKRRLHKQISDFKDLLHHLADSKLISEDSYMKMMVSISILFHSCQSVFVSGSGTSFSIF